MDPRIWKKPWSKLLKGKAIEVVDTPEVYLKLTTRCMEQVNRFRSARGSSLPKFNQEQCKYLAIKLQLAIQSANSIIKDVNAQFLSLDHPKEKEQLLEIFKLLYVMGVKVKGLIQNCCKEAWIQSAIMLTNMLEQVATIGLNLEFFTNTFFARLSQGESALPHFDATRIRNAEIQIVKEKADLDRMKLIMDLNSIVQSNTSSSAEWQLATFLLERVKTVTLPLVANSPRSKERVLPFTMSSLQQLPDHCLGTGTFGSVYKALWLGVEVAQKTFYGPSGIDFLQEVSILDGLSHPNIVSLLWYMTEEKRCHIVMELMDGNLFSLMQQRMRENGNQRCPFSIPEALELILQIGEGMLYLHEKRIVHRDLKSVNILFTAKPNVKYLQVKVADFGLSRTKERSATHSNMTMNVGTTRWMAPEVMRVGNVHVDGERKASLNYPFKIDIYSFAMVCYEILTGEVPFSSLSHGEVKKAVLSGDRPPLPRECPYRLRTLIKSCWIAEASKRPHFGNICEELRDLKYAKLQIYWKATIYQCPLKDMETIDMLVAKFSSPIAEVQQSASDDIRLLAKERLDLRMYILQKGIRLLFALYCSGDIKTRKHAFGALQALFVGDTKPTIRRSSMEEVSLRCNATLADRSLSRALSKYDYFDMLLLYDRFVEEKWKEYAAISLFRMCRYEEDYASVIQAGVVPLLWNLIAQPSDDTVHTTMHSALIILAGLTKINGGLTAIAKVGPISTLVKIIASDSRWNTKLAAEILFELCLDDPQFIKEARKSNVVEPLTLFAQHLLTSISSRQLAKALLLRLQKPEVDNLQLKHQ